MDDSAVLEDLTEKEDEGQDQEWLSDKDLEAEPKKKRARKS